MVKCDTAVFFHMSAPSKNTQRDVLTLLLPFVPQVVPVSYVRFSTSPVLYTHNRESLKALPLGIVLTFNVHFHASTGEALHSSNSHITFSTNRSVITQSIGSLTQYVLIKK